MNKILSIALVLASVNAFAVSKNNSWAEINASRLTDVRAPQVAFAAGQATSFVSVFDVCHAGDTVRTTKAMPIFEQVRYAGRDGGTELVQVGSEVLETASSYTVVVEREKGSPTKTIEIQIGRNYSIPVYAAHTGKDREEQLMFTKSFVMPLCK